jgi:hypothetical protein
MKLDVAVGSSKLVRQTMLFELEAVYESGVLKLDHVLPLEDHQRVKVVVQERTSIGRGSEEGDWWRALQNVLANQSKRGFVGTVDGIDRNDDGYEQRMREILNRTAQPRANG